MRSDILIVSTLPSTFSVKVTARNSNRTRFLHNLSASYTENSIDVVTQSAAPTHGASDSPLAASASADTAHNMHNINLHNFNLCVHILIGSSPLHRATSHLHTLAHSTGRYTDADHGYTEQRIHRHGSTRSAFPRMQIVSVAATLLRLQACKYQIKMIYLIEIINLAMFKREPAM